ncbi:MAG: PHP domain-containing protein [Clostridia bacterium]|nr:PHP domain-containing protein [Clostridia bacterium]
MKHTEKHLGQILLAIYHTHTTRCFNAGGTFREYIEAAIQYGYHTLGFAEHAPYIFTNGHETCARMPVVYTEDYATSLAALKEEYKNDIRILIGYEMEYYPEFFDVTLRNMLKYPIDFLIMGQHHIDNEYTGKRSANPTTDESLLAMYVDEVIAGMRTDLYSYIAHPNIFKFVGDMQVYEDHMRRLCEEAKRLEIPLEANLGYIYEDGATEDPQSEHLFRVAAEVGNKIVYGCDAHEPEGLNAMERYERVSPLINRYGLQVISEFRIRDPHRYLQKTQ